MTDVIRRAVLLVLVIAVIVGVGLADAGRGGGQSASGGSLARGVPSASGIAVARSDAESSASFCAGATGSGGNARATIILTNPEPRAVTGTVTTLAAGTTSPAVAGPQSMAVRVPADDQIAVVPAPSESGGALASTVVLNGGGVGVSQVVTGPLGYSAAPCAATTAGTWYFADGSTAGNNTLSLSLFNPSPTTAVIDVTFVSSTSGLLAPPAYQGIDVPGDSLVEENVGDHVRNAPDLATMVTSLSGAVVAAELESAGPSGNGGPSVLLGAVKPSPAWTFARNMNVSGASTVFHLFNPTGRPARVTMKIGLSQGAAEPLVLRLPAMSVSVIDAAGVTRIPSNVAFSATFSTSGGAGIVVNRSLSSPSGAVPAPQVGEVSGLPGGTDRWLLPAPSTPATGISSLTIVDLNETVVTVRLAAVSTKGLVTVPGFAHNRVRAGTPLIVSPGAGSVIGSTPLEVVASGPVAVEVDAAPVGNPGVVVIPALPLP